MASGTGNLPNDGMVFNPFDVLNAEEMNELVANIESLADGSGIGDGSITANKFAGPVVSSTNPSSFSTSSSSAVVVTGTAITITVPAGVTKIKISAAVYTNNAVNFLTTNLAIYKNGASIAGATTRNLSGGASQWSDTVPLLALDTVTPSTSVTYDLRCAVTGTSGTTTIGANGANMIVEAVG